MFRTIMTATRSDLLFECDPLVFAEGGISKVEFGVKLFGGGSRGAGMQF